MSTTAAAANCHGLRCAFGFDVSWRGCGMSSGTGIVAGSFRTAAGVVVDEGARGGGVGMAIGVSSIGAAATGLTTGRVMTGGLRTTGALATGCVTAGALMTG